MKTTVLSVQMIRSVDGELADAARMYSAEIEYSDPPTSLSTALRLFFLSTSSEGLVGVGCNQPVCPLSVLTVLSRTWPWAVPSLKAKSCKPVLWCLLLASVEEGCGV